MSKIGLCCMNRKDELVSKYLRMVIMHLHHIEDALLRKLLLTIKYHSSPYIFLMRASLTHIWLSATIKLNAYCFMSKIGLCCMNWKDESVPKHLRMVRMHLHHIEWQYTKVSSQYRSESWSAWYQSKSWLIRIPE